MVKKPLNQLSESRSKTLCPQEREILCCLLKYLLSLFESILIDSLYTAKKALVKLLEMLIAMNMLSSIVQFPVYNLEMLI